MANSLFQCMGALGREGVVANTIGSLALLALLVFGGFIISRGINSLTSP